MWNSISCPKSFLTFSDFEALCVHYSKEHCSLRADKVWFPCEVRAPSQHTCHSPFSCRVGSFYGTGPLQALCCPPVASVCPVCTHACTATSCCCPRWWVWDSSFDAGESLSPSGLLLAPSWLWTAPISSIHFPPRAAVWMEKIIALSAWMLCLTDNWYCITDVKGIMFLSFYFIFYLRSTIFYTLFDPQN